MFLSLTDSIQRKYHAFFSLKCFHGGLNENKYYHAYVSSQLTLKLLSQPHFSDNPRRWNESISRRGNVFGRQSGSQAIYKRLLSLENIFHDVIWSKSRIQLSLDLFFKRFR